MTFRGRMAGLFPAVGALALAAGIAHAGDYARDPCAIPDVVAALPGGGADLQARFSELAARSGELDAASAAFNRECDVQNPVGSPGEVACAARERDIGAAIDGHGANVAAFNANLDSLLQSRIAALQLQMAASRRELARMPSNTRGWQKEMEDWIDLGEEARNEARIRAAFTAIDMVVDSEQESSGEDIALDESALRTYKSIVRSGRDFIPAEFRAGLEQELLTLRTKRDVLTMLQHLASMADRVYTTNQPLSRQQSAAGFAQFVAGVLKETLALMRADPRAKAAVVVLEMSEQASYGWLARIVAVDRIDQFDGLEEKQLRAVAAIGRLYVSQVQDFRALSAAQAALHGSACYLK